MHNQNILRTKPRHRNRKPRLTKHMEVHDRERFGHLTARTRWARSAGRKEREYRCVCDCGQSLFLTYRVLLQRREENLGCCQPGCTSSPVINAVWAVPEAALLYQWRQARAAYPNQLCAEWGGYAYEGITPDPDGYSKFLDVIMPQVDITNGKWWLHRENEDLPLYELNVILKEYPDTGIFNPKSINISLFGSSYSLNELAKTYSINNKLLLKKWSEITDDEEFITWVIAESHKGE